MKIYQHITEVKIRKPVVTIGVFDGVHLGHQRILKQLQEEAEKTHSESLVITFWPHPRSILSPESRPLSFLTTPEEKYKLFQQAGIDGVLVIPFTKEFANMSSQTFIKDIIVDGLCAAQVIIGFNHHFGKNREGNFEKLKEASTDYNFNAQMVKPLIIENHRVSSSAIRKNIEEGHIYLANKMLGYPYFISGTVVNGDHLGHKLGFPTANIDTRSLIKVLPKDGVYAVSISVQGKLFQGMANVGIRPTINANKQRNLEVHIFDFNKDIYNEKISIHFHEWIREEKKFSDIDNLKEQIFADKIEIIAKFKKKKLIP